MDQSIKAIESVKEIIINNQFHKDGFRNFVLQGGAGSGKTESLKEVIEFISNSYPNQKIACITHTNIAVDEIRSRIKNTNLWVSTIHSFLNEQTKNFQKNLQEVLPYIFYIDNSDINDYEDYKKRYEKLSKLSYKLNNRRMDKVVGKRDYNADIINYNNILLGEIKSINSMILEVISSKDFRDIKYNETVFDSISDGTFSHDSLIKVSYFLAEKYSLFSKIISDKFDYIFIDEYQDTDKVLVDLLLKKIAINKKTTIGFFGDSMQGIYDGIGSLDDYIRDFNLIYIPKDDNYRCSQQVIDFLNIIRNDDIKQKVALKKGETLDSRQGSVKIYINKIQKVKSNGHQEDKEKYIALINDAIKKVKEKSDILNLNILQLTNKSIASELKFSKLFKVFEDRYLNLEQTQIESNLKKIQVKDVVDLIFLYKNNRHNDLILKLKKNNLKIKKLDDKINIISRLSYICDNDLGLNEALDYCYENKLLIKSPQRIDFESQSKRHFEQCDSDPVFKDLKTLLERDNLNTYNRAKQHCTYDIDQYDYDDFMSSYRKIKFSDSLLSNNLLLSEVLNYFNYIEENSNSDEKYLTMHKTKGTGIENVFVVLEEFFWSNYSFRSIYDSSYSNFKVKEKSEKLFYVACSRTIKNLMILINYETNDELELIREKFSGFEIIELNSSDTNLLITNPDVENFTLPAAIESNIQVSI
ncbi:AAA family ATPase [Acinetobacter baumannii]|uniref:UvrD-helicase domain-containing protein n=1 Tax=Acinetobacter baumannii TaxID=470 RepID=UPI0028704516|nr:UvrD-helicase domain-containing protein [Acinetobacter baumannii]MDR9542365.1 AAA family ATPase [Acinetobacter baumannii]